MKRVFFFLLLCGWMTFAAAQSLQFIREDVLFRLDSVHLEVSAELWFRNPGPQPITQTIHIPFACEGTEYKVDSLRVTDCSVNSTIKPFRQNIAGTLIQVTVAGAGQKKIKIDYIQNHDRKRAGYILTKIKYWNKPLPHGDYTLVVENASIRIDSTSLKPDAITTEEGKLKQTWRKSNFTPQKDLCFYFHLE